MPQATTASPASLTDSLPDRIETIQKKGVVPGLLFHLTTDRLKGYLKERAAHHRTRAKEKRDEIPAIRAQAGDMDAIHDRIRKLTADAAPAVSVGGKGAANFTNYSPGAKQFDAREVAQSMTEQADALAAEVKAHENKAVAFDLLADSLFDAPYALSYAELAAMEIVPRA